MKRRTVRLSVSAERDFHHIVAWIADRAGEPIARAYAQRLQRYCDGLDIASYRGAARDDLHPGLRIIGFEKRVTVAFIVEDATVTIVRLFYGGRDWENEAL